MDQDRKRAEQRNELDAQKPQLGRQHATEEPEVVESTPPAVDETAPQAGEAPGDAVDEGGDLAASDAGSDNDVGLIGDVEPAENAVEAASVDQPPLAAEALTESDSDNGAAEPAFDALPTPPTTQDTQAAEMGDVGAPPASGSNKSDTLTEESFDSADVVATETGDASPHTTSPALVTPPLAGPLVVDAASFSPPSAGTTGGSSDDPPKTIALASQTNSQQGQLLEVPNARYDDPVSIEKLPYIPGREPDGPKIMYLADAPNRSSDQGTVALPDEAGPGVQAPRWATNDGGSALTCPAVLVGVPDAEMRRVIEEALAPAAALLAQTLGEIAEEKVEDALWVRACHERAVYRN